jgi:hypothetical protein
MKNLILILIALSFFGCHKKETINNDNINIEQKEGPTEFNVLLGLHNNHRSKKLILDNDLCTLAQKHSAHMADRQKLVHSDLSKLEYKIIGENIAYGQTSEEEVFNDWMNSYGHKQNIINKNYNKIGFGKSKSKSDRFYWCVIFAN